MEKQGAAAGLRHLTDDPFDCSVQNWFAAKAEYGRLDVREKLLACLSILDNESADTTNWINTNWTKIEHLLADAWRQARAMSLRKLHFMTRVEKFASTEPCLQGILDEVRQQRGDRE